MANMERINITIDQDTREFIDAVADTYGMNRSETIRFMAEVLQNLDAFWILENAVIEESKYNSQTVTGYKLLRASRNYKLIKKTDNKAMQ